MSGSATDRGFTPDVEVDWDYQSIGRLQGLVDLPCRPVAQLQVTTSQVHSRAWGIRQEKLHNLPANPSVSSRNERVERRGGHARSRQTAARLASGRCAAAHPRRAAARSLTAAAPRPWRRRLAAAPAGRASTARAIRSGESLAPAPWLRPSLRRFALRTQFSLRPFFGSVFPKTRLLGSWRRGFFEEECPSILAPACRHSEAVLKRRCGL